MSRFIPVLVGLLTALTASTPLHAQNASLEPPHVSNITQQQEMLKQDVALQLAPVKSRQDLEQHLRSSGSASPLAALSESGKRRFIASLKFNDSGITSFSYGDLQAELNASQIYQVMSLFGAQHTVAMMRNVRIQDAVDEQIMRPLGGPPGPVCPSQPCEYEGYECAKKATCSYNINTICMRNC